jgi:hypothetical protein
MKTAGLRQAKIETRAQDATSGRVVDRTAKTSLASHQKQELRRWRAGSAFTAMREAIALGRRVRARNKPNTLRD